MMELPNHLVPWDTVKILLKGAWDEGFDAGELDAMDNLNNDNHECIPNPYDQEDE